MQHPRRMIRLHDDRTQTLRRRVAKRCLPSRSRVSHGSCALQRGGGSMQIIWMVLVTLVLALSGILGLALVTRIAAWARRRDPQPKP
jgi:hypothetical protein